MLPSSLQSLVSAPRPAFLCKIAGARKIDRHHVALVKCALQPSPKARGKLGLTELGIDPGCDLASFYLAHDGATLFSCVSTGMVPLELFRVKDMSSHTKKMRRWFKAYDFPDVEPIEDPFHLRSAVAIGGSPGTAAYIVITTSGPHPGKYFAVDHGCNVDRPLATSFADLIDQVAMDPVQFLRAVGANAIYSDGTSCIPWQPIQYSGDCNFPSSESEA
jgi:hypothetical protein